MPTTKPRLNITLSKEVDWALNKIAKQDRVPVATKAAELIHKALLIEEDSVWARLADERRKEKSKHYSHKQAWNLK